MGRIGNRVAQTLADFIHHFIPGGDREHEDLNIEQLATSFLEYVGMRLPVFPEQGMFVEVDELIFRYGETKWAVEEALRLLESRGFATPTNFEGLWRLRVDFEAARTTVR